MLKTISQLLVAFLFILASCSVSSEKEPATHEAIIKKDVVEFMEGHMNKGNWEGVINMMYPKLFDISPKAQLIAQMQQMELMGINITAKNTKVVGLSELIKEGEEQFCRIDYTSDLTIKIATEAESMIPMFKAQFDKAYGAKNVLYDEKNSLFRVKSAKSMIGVAPINTDDWTYFEFNKNQQQLLELLLPKKVRKKLS